MLWGILPSKDRLNHIKPKEYTNPLCPLCSTPGHPRPETLAHALTECEANKGFPDLLLDRLQVHAPELSFRQVQKLDLELEPSREARCQLLRDRKDPSFFNVMS